MCSCGFNEWRKVYDRVPYGITTVTMYSGVACAICGDWYEEEDDVDEWDREEGEEEDEYG